MYCKYCNETMMGQDNDRLGNYYCKLYVCTNDKCKAVYEQYSTLNGVKIAEKHRWFNPKTSKFEK